MHLFLQCGEFSQVAEEADGAGGFLLATANRGDGDAKFAMIAIGSDVGGLLSAKDFSIGETLTNQGGQGARFAKRFAVAAKQQALDAKRLLGGWISHGEQAIRADEAHAGRAV